ncbi:MAG: dipeptidase [Ktedonobacteraceae bacterium]|nr:dipeptidase [Ktedonobacteraceae bacterium]MBO0795335.1 dipeptidase [Ktedonobacteraceae bacterium]
MMIIDAHEDIAYNALELERDFRVSAYTTRRREARKQLKVVGSDLDEANDTPPRDFAMSGLPDLRRGGFAVVFGVIFASPTQEETRKSLVSYRNVDEAYSVGQEQLAFYRQLAEDPGISLIRSKQDLHEVLVAWEGTREDDSERPLGIVPLMEGADPIRIPAEVEDWFANGVRIVGLSWAKTRYCGGTFGLGPLTRSGRSLLSEMERVGMILDTTHISEEGFWQALEHFHGPVIASHSNCRSLTMAKAQLSPERARVVSERHLSDEMIRALAERGAVIGIVPFNAYLDASWSRDHRFDVGLEQMVQHIDHVCQLTGNALHVGLGSDIDGGFGRDETPVELDTVADLAKLGDALRTAGYKEEDVANIMGGNWRRFLEQSLPTL